MGKKRAGLFARLHTDGLQRKLGLYDLFAIGYGDLGSSIFYALGITTFFALGASPICLILAGLVFVCTALTYAEMTSALKATGGSAVFARHAFNDLISFIAGWGLLLDFIVTIAISIFSVAPYLAFLIGGLQSTSIHLGFSVALIAILFMMNFYGTKHSTRVSIFLTGGALITELLILVVALITVDDFGRVFREMRINVAETWSPSWGDFWKGTAMAMVAYTGIESIAALGAETKKPVKTLPRAVMTVMAVLITMYLGLSIVGLSVMTPQELGGEYIHNPITGIVNNLPIGAKVLGPWVGLLAAALLFVAGNAGLLGASRLSFNMGEFYQLPRFFYRTHKKYKTPIVSLAIFAVLAALVILWSRGQLHFLADLYNFGAMLAFTAAHISLIMLRIKQPHLERPFKAPLNIRITKDISLPLTAILGGLSTLGVWILVVYTKPEGRILGFTWMAIGIAMYIVYRKKKKIAPTAQVKLEKVVVPGFEPIDIKHILVPTRGAAETESVQIACEVAKVHGAHVTAIHVLEVAYSLPLNVPLPYRQRVAESVLQRAEAIAHEFGVEIDSEVVHARSVEESILQYIIEKDCDFLVLGALQSSKDPHAGLGTITDRILRRSPCRVLVTANFK